MTDKARENDARRRTASKERDRVYLLTLTRTSASCLTLFITMGVLIFLNVFEVSLGDLRGVMAGVTITAAGLYLWADGAINTVWSKVFPDPRGDEEIR
jgi:hypothetical protein